MKRRFFARCLLARRTQSGTSRDLYSSLAQHEEGGLPLNRTMPGRAIMSVRAVALRTQAVSPESMPDICV
jgi:hypothetical protein